MHSQTLRAALSRMLNISPNSSLQARAPGVSRTRRTVPVAASSTRDVTDYAPAHVDPACSFPLGVSNPECQPGGSMDVVRASSDSIDVATPDLQPSTSSAPPLPTGGVWGMYMRNLEANPLITKCLTSFSGFLLGDLIAQGLAQDGWDPSRTFILAAYGVHLSSRVFKRCAQRHATPAGTVGHSARTPCVRRVPCSQRVKRGVACTSSGLPLQSPTGLATVNTPIADPPARKLGPSILSLGAACSSAR